MKTIPLTKGKFAIVDDEDFKELSKYKWHATNTRNGNFYAIRTNKPKLMHRLIMNVDKGLQVDHINHETLNNQKANLRIATHSQNQRNRKIQVNNTSGYKGIYFDKDRKKWRAYIKAEGRRITIGRYLNKIDAVMAYNESAKKYFKEFACLNII